MAESFAARLEQVAAITARDRWLIAAHRQETPTMAGTPDKLGALLDTARVLDALHAPYALIGGVAVGIHSGVPRATVDTDLAVHSAVDRARIRRALTEAGFTFRGEFRHSDNFRHASGEPVQLVVDPAFDPMVERAARFQVAGVSIPIVTKDDLIAMTQRAANDPTRRRSKALRDQADVELLRGEPPDPDEGW